MMTTARVRLSGTWTAPALWAVAASYLLAFASPAPADVLVLKDGKTVEGEIRETDAAYEVKTPFGTLTVTKTDVARRVPPADAIAAEAETLRTVAKGMIEEANGVADAKARDRKLAAAAEILGKAANLLVDARSVYTGDAYAHLDRAAAELIGEARRCRERMAPLDTPPAPQPVKPTPPATPTPGPPAVPAATLPTVDILAPPPPPTARAAPADVYRVEGAQEGEALKIVGCTGGTTRPQSRAPLWKGHWSGEAQLWWTGGKTGDALTLQFESDEAGPRSLALGLVKSFDYGLVKILVNGKTVSAALDLYAPDVTPAEVALPVELKAGPNELELQLAGANPSARGMHAGLDYVAVRVAPAGGVAGVERPPADPAVPVPASPADKLMADARKMADGKRTTDARTIAARVIKQYPGTPAADEAQALLNTLPHPDGRLVSGFDTEADLRAWHVYRPRLVKLESAADPKEIYEGKGAGRMTVLRDSDHTTGAIVLELGKFDETRFRGLSLWIYQAQPSPGRLEVAFIRGKQESLPWVSEEGDSEIGACFYWATTLNFTGWRQFKVSAQQLLPRGSGGVSGKITWRDVGAVVIYDAARKGMDVVLDSLRFIELEK